MYILDYYESLSDHASGDHLLKPLGLGLVIKVQAAHQVIACKGKKPILNIHQVSNIHDQPVTHFDLV